MTTAQITALDLFAGTGWGVACRRLGIREMGVEIMPEAIATRDANGMATIYRDVWDGLEGKFHVPKYQVLIASPPCQTFSLAGKGSGRAALNEVLEAIELHAYKEPSLLREFGEKHDPRTALVLAPLAHIWRDRPEYVALEQVPTVLPVWEAYAAEMADWGYSTDVAILNAEQYGVPQTRRRAILVGRLNGEAKLPTPTHSRYYPTKPTKLDEGVLPWVSMADALGWGMTDAPMHTIVAGTHGPTDRWASGGSSVRKQLDAKIGGPNWKPNPAPAAVDSRTTYADRIGIQEAAALQTYPVPLRREIDEWKWRDAPATTIAGDPRITAREHHYHGEQSKTSLRLEQREAEVLQTFPNGFVWPCTKTKAFLQIGNAVPPLLGQAILYGLIFARRRAI